MENKNSFSEEEVVRRHCFRMMLESVFIPNMIQSVIDGNATYELLYSTNVWKEILDIADDNFHFEWDNFRCQISKSDINGKNYVLYLFPSVEKVHESICGIVMYDNSTNKAKYFTLETSFFDRYVIGSSNGKEHHSYGFLPTTDDYNYNTMMRDFCNWVFYKSEDATPVISSPIPNCYIDIKNDNLKEEYTKWVMKDMEALSSWDVFSGSIPSY